MWLYFVVFFATIFFVLKFTPYGDGIVEHILTNYRGLFATFFLLPLSGLFDGYLYVRNKISFYLHSAPKLHDTKVKKIQDEIVEWNKEGRKVKLCTARPGYLTMSMRCIPSFLPSFLL